VLLAKVVRWYLRHRVLWGSVRPRKWPEQRVESTSACAPAANGRGRATSEPGRGHQRMSQYSRHERNPMPGLWVGNSPRRTFPAAPWLVWSLHRNNLNPRPLNWAQRLTAAPGATGRPTLFAALCVPESLVRCSPPISRSLLATGQSAARLCKIERHPASIFAACRQTEFRRFDREIGTHRIETRTSLTDPHQA